MLLLILFSHVDAFTTSIHLNYQTPPKVTAFQVQVTVPEGKDLDKAYWVAVGFDKGYFGIQTKTKTERWINFSVWNKVGAAKLDKKGPGVVEQNFNHEGSGVQTHRSFFWKTGVPQSFMVTVRPSQSGSAVVSGFFLIDGKWELIASIERPGASPYLTGLHSFLENFGSDNSLMRKGRYSNLFYQEEGKEEWTPVTHALTHNAQPSHADDSWMHSVDDKGFVMEIDGKTKTRTTRSTLDFKGATSKPLPLPGKEGAGGIHIPGGNYKDDSGPPRNHRDMNGSREDSNSKGNTRGNLNEGQGNKVNDKITGNTQGNQGVQTGTRQPDSRSGLKYGDFNKHNVYGASAKHPTVDPTSQSNIDPTKGNGGVQTGTRQPDSRPDINYGKSVDSNKHNVYRDSRKRPNVGSTSKNNIDSTKNNKQKDPVGVSGVGKKKKKKKKKRTKKKGKKCRVYKKRGLLKS
jgi:hypothetical protein